MATELQRLAHQYVTGRFSTRAIRQATANNERRVLRYFTAAMGERRPGQIGRTDIERWLGTMNDLSPGTVRGRFAIVRRFLTWLVDTDVIRRSPARLIAAPKVPRSRHRALSSDQTGAILASCRDARDMLIVELGLQLGLRRAEVAAIQVGDITWGKRPSLLVHGKGGHERTLPLTTDTVKAIQRYLTATPAPGGPLIRGDKYPTRGVSPDWVGKVFQRISYDSGVKVCTGDGVSMHATRHTAATDVWEATGDIVAVKELLGHQSLSTTEVYVDTLNTEKLRAAIEGRTYGAAVVELIPQQRSRGTQRAA